MSQVLFFISFLFFLIAVALAFFLEGHVIDRLNAIYPNEYKKYTWFYCRLRVFYFLVKIKSGSIDDSVLLQLSRKLIFCLAVIIASWLCIGLTIALF
jgi:hypothetical protein